MNCFARICEDIFRQQRGEQKGLILERAEITMNDTIRHFQCGVTLSFLAMNCLHVRFGLIPI